MALHIMRQARAILEATRGAGGTPTRYVYFDEAEHDQDIATIRPKTVKGSYFGYYGSSAGREKNSLHLKGALSFDDGPWYANVGIKAVATGTGAGADKTWVFVPTSGSDDIKSAAMQVGYSDSIGATRPASSLIYLLGDELSFKWDKAANEVTYDLVLRSPKVASDISAFTGSPTDRSVKLCSAAATAVYIDTTTIGSTADANLLSIEWGVKNGYTDLDTLNNSAGAQDTLRPDVREWTAKVRRYYGDKTEHDAYVAKTLRKLRVKTLGPVLGGSFYKVELDLYGVYTDYKKAEVDGFGIEEFTLSGQYDGTATTDFGLTFVNADSAIT